MSNINCIYSKKLLNDLKFTFLEKNLTADYSWLLAETKMIMIIIIMHSTKILLLLTKIGPILLHSNNLIHCDNEHTWKLALVFL